MNRDEIIESLKRGIVFVDFTKTNGERRQMRCTLVGTLESDRLPPEEPATDKTLKPINENVIAAWDVEKNGWRSFRVDNVLAWSEEAWMK